MDRGSWWARVHGVMRVRHECVTNTHTANSFITLLLKCFLVYFHPFIALLLTCLNLGGYSLFDFLILEWIMIMILILLVSNLNDVIVKVS